jgi:para-nitrobenzyl esterase
VMLTAWTNFARFGDPNGQQGGQWAPYTSENPRFMIFRLDDNDAVNSEMGEPLRP